MCTLLDEAFGDITPALSIYDSRGDALCLEIRLPGGACIYTYIWLVMGCLYENWGQQMGREVSMI